MTARDDIELVLGEWLNATAPTAPPAGLHESVIERARQGRPRSRWLAAVHVRLGSPASGSAMRLAYLALLAGLLVAALLAAMLVGGLNRSVPETPAGIVERVTAFTPPFDVTVPAWSGLRQPAGRPPPGLVAWVEGSRAVARPPDDSGSEAGQEEGGYPRGIVIGSVTHAWTHRCNGGDRAPLRLAPAELLADLRHIGGVGLGPQTATTLGGRPATTADVRPDTQRCSTDLHVGGGMSGLGGGGFHLLNLPSRVTAVDLDGVTVFIQVWARTEEDLAAWMPEAAAFVNSIRFIERP